MTSQCVNGTGVCPRLSSHWLKPIFKSCYVVMVVQKKGGDIRLCVDYPQLNTKTRKDAYPLPRIEESLDALSGARWFSTLDLASGYKQVPMAERDKEKTAFCTPFGLFEINRMPFVLERLQQHSLKNINVKMSFSQREGGDLLQPLNSTPS